MIRLATDCLPSRLGLLLKRFCYYNKVPIHGAIDPHGHRLWACIDDRHDYQINRKKSETIKTTSWHDLEYDLTEELKSLGL
jgi:hypothetical protein